MDADRPLHRLQWLHGALGDDSLTLEPASSDASFRSYWRTVGHTPPWIVMDAPPTHEDVRPWLHIAQRLRDAGLNAPHVLAADVEQGFLLISDLGRELYLPALDGARADALYDAALEVLVTLATQVDSNGLPGYDEARLVDEMELMPTWFLQRHLGYTPECEEWDVVETAFRALVNNAREQPQVFVHRDFHSRNLLLPQNCGDGPGIIDFQDAVRGPVTYDVVSLLRDCYVAWPEARVSHWMEDFRRRLVAAGIPGVGDEARFRRWFDLMGLQRHIKVLGIFCRLCYRDAKPGYLGDLPRVWGYVHDVGSRYPETLPLVELLRHRIGAHDLTRVAA